MAHKEKVMFFGKWDLLLALRHLSRVAAVAQRMVVGCAPQPSAPAAEDGVRTRGSLTRDSTHGLLVMSWRAVPPSQHGRSPSGLDGRGAWLSLGV